MKPILKLFLVFPFLVIGIAFALGDKSTSILNPETNYNLPSGALFNVPKGWLVQPKGGKFILRDPDGKMTLVLAESEESDGQDAINEVWKFYNPNFSSPVMHVNHYTKPDNWEEEYRVWYYVASDENPRKPSETRGLYAISKKKNQRWYVGLLDFDMVAVDKRQAQVDIILGSLKMLGDKAHPTPIPVGRELDAKFLKTFEDFLEQARTRCKVPGAAVAIVKDGKVVYAKGFGVCEKGKIDPVTTKTLFSIASMTKPLTTL
ncbi:MAG TPA: serine hydrolase domain-containing protein, partial [bacterium]